MASSQLLKLQDPLFLVLCKPPNLLVAAKVREGARGRAKWVDGKTNLKLSKAPFVHISYILRLGKKTSPMVVGSKHMN